MFPNTSDGQSVPVLAGFSLPPQPPKSTKSTNAFGPFDLRKRFRTKDLPHPVHKLIQNITKPHQSTIGTQRADAREKSKERLNISKPINAVQPSTQISQINAGEVKRYIGHPMITQTYCKSSRVDPHNYILRSLDDQDQHDLQKIKAYTQLVTQNSAHFAEHQIFIGDLNVHPTLRRRYLGCATNSLDLIFFLGVNPVFIGSDLLYFIAHKAWAIVSVLNKNGFAWDHRIELLNCLQLWTIQEGSSHGVRFDLKLGKCLRDVHHLVLTLMIGSLAALLDRLSIRQDHEKLNMQALNALLNVILKVAEAMRSFRPETFQFPDKELSALKRAINKPGEPRYSTEKVQSNLAQIHEYKEKSTSPWFFHK